MNIEMILVIAFSIILGAALLFAIVVKIMVASKYIRYNRTEVQNGLTGETAARLLLDNLGLEDVKVVKSNWIMAWLFGNCYRTGKKIIRLRPNVFNKSSVTAIGIASQKVALAMQHKRGEKMVVIRSTLLPVIQFAPMMFVPLVVVGIAIDILISNTVGLISLLVVGLGLLYYIVAFILTLVTIPIENKANKEALEYLKKTNMLNESEQGILSSMFKTFILSYIADFILSLLYLIKYIYKLLNVSKKIRR